MNNEDLPDELDNKDLPDELKVLYTWKNDAGEVTYVFLQSTGARMLAADHDAAVDRWRRGLPLEVRTRAGKAQKDHIRVLDVAIRAVKEFVPDEDVASRLADAIVAKVAAKFYLQEKSVKDMLNRYHKTGKL